MHFAEIKINKISTATIAPVVKSVALRSQGL
jgi:hypothetical protein